MNNLNIFPFQNAAFAYVLLLWILIWKGVALWKSARNNQRNWFIALLILNTAGLLEIAYLFYFAKKKMKLSEFLFWKPQEEK